MIRVIFLALLLAACTPTPNELPEDFDSSFAF
ncbi:MAG: DNA polymerase III subunit chi [Pseudomonadota bacterium]